MPAKSGESVGEMLAVRSSEKARANPNRGTTEEQGAAFTQFLKEWARTKKRSWKMRLPPTWGANDPENKVPEGNTRAAATLPTPGGCVAIE